MDKPRNEKDSANANEPSVYVIDLSASSSNQGTYYAIFKLFIKTKNFINVLVPVDKTQHENGSTSANRPSVHVIDFSASSSSQSTYYALFKLFIEVQKIFFFNHDFKEITCLHNTSYSGIK